jgi:hypothetical protein
MADEESRSTCGLQFFLVKKQLNCVVNSDLLCYTNDEVGKDMLFR